MPGTGLANFREQFPQYDHIDDEELAGLVKERYYPDMADEEYRDAMGLEPPPEPPKEPTLWERATSIFRSEEDKPENVLSDKPDLVADFDLPEPEPAQPGTLAEQFFAGIDEYRANRATARGFEAVEDYRDAEAVARGEKDPNPFGSGILGVSGEMIANVARNARAQAGDPEAERAIQEQIAGNRERLEGVMQAAIDDRAELMSRAQQIGYSQATQEMLQAEGWEALGEFTDDPVQIVLEVGLRSLPNMADALPLAVAGGIAGGPYGFATGMGYGAGLAEYRASFADALQQEGVNLTSAESLLAASLDDELMARVHEFASRRSTIIGAASTLSGGIATRTVTPFIKNQVAKQLTNVAAQTVIQAGIEGGGEALAQLATEGEIHGGEVLAEAVGGAMTAPIDVATATVSGVRAQHAIDEAARVESEVNEILKRDVPRETQQEAVPDPAETSQIEPDSATETQAAAEPVQQDLFDGVPEYADERLRSAQTRSELQEASADIDPTTASGRRAHRAVNRAITGRPLSEPEQRVVGSLLDILDERTDADVLDMATPGDRRGGRRGRGPDRRQARRERIQALSLDELVDKVYTDKLTGIANRRAFDEDADNHAWVAEVDADSLKWINDNISEEAGDALLIAVAEAIDQTDVDAYRIGGDEFVLGGQTREEVEAAAELAKGILANQRISDTKGTVTGLNITYGVGQSKEIASASLKQNKTRREQEGKRSPRGIAPPGAELTVAHTKPVDMQPGTNYVSIIGNHGALPIDANNNLILGNGRRVQIPKTPVRREHILALMQRAFGNRIYQGRVKGRTRLGFYRPGQGEIRIKNANDIEVAAHEVAHWLDDRYPWISALYQRYKRRGQISQLRQHQTVRGLGRVHAPVHDPGVRGHQAHAVVLRRVPQGARQAPGARVDRLRSAGAHARVDPAGRSSSAGVENGHHRGRLLRADPPPVHHAAAAGRPRRSAPRARGADGRRRHRHRLPQTAPGIGRCERRARGLDVLRHPGTARRQTGARVHRRIAA